MKGIIIGIERNERETAYKIVMYANNNGEWKFTRQIATERSLVSAISSKQVDIVNAKVVNGKLKGRTGDLARFDNKVNKPLVIIAELAVKDRGTIGYKIANSTGAVKNIPVGELLAYCAKTTKQGGVPIQNGMYVADTESQKAFIRAYPDGEYEKELIERHRSKNAKPAQINTEENNKSISKIEELFNKEQIAELKLGKKNGIDIKIYGNNKLSAHQMKVIREGLEEGLNTKLFADPEYSVDAMRLLRADMKYGVDVGYYLNPKYSAEQLSELAIGFISGVDVDKYADPSINPEEMSEIRMRLENNIWKEHSVKNDASWK